jgi:hypothetical protein
MNADLPDRSEISAMPERADTSANRQGSPASEGALKPARAALIQESSRDLIQQQVFQRKGARKPSRAPFPC